MWAMAGDLPGFEEASRAFYRRNYARFDEIIAPWPEGIRDHVVQLVAAVRQSEVAA